jgi:glycosyltransferase involved in cell wall biosynthesis
MDLSVVIPAWREADNLAKLLPQLHRVLSDLEMSSSHDRGSMESSGPARGIEYEIIVVDNHSPDATEEVCRDNGTVLLQQTAPGYGGALWAGFERATGDYVLTMDADLSHVPDFIPAMWERRDDAEVVIASRYVQGGGADMPRYRHVLSVILNVVYTKALDLPVEDISSGFRLYHADILRGLDLQSTDFDALEEILIKCFAEGCKIAEIPFRYVPRDEGRSKVRLLHFGISYLRTLFRMWRLRNSIASADYDARAFDSPIPLQRYWQRRRHAIITGMVDQSKPALDIGCGSSRILATLHDGSVGVDVNLGKLRYARCYSRPLVRASIFALPFADHALEQVVCSQVIEHLPAGTQPFLEITRVLKDGGCLILGTPDYGRANWVIIERLYKLFAPDAYGDEHITHYTYSKLLVKLEGLGFQERQLRYICGAEMILSLDKVDRKG